MHRQGVIALAPGIQSPYADPLGGVRQRERERNDFHSARASSPVRADGGACAVPGHAGIVGWAGGGQQRTDVAFWLRQIASLGAEGSGGPIMLRLVHGDVNAA